MISDFIVSITPISKLTTFRGTLVIKIEAENVEEAETMAQEALEELVNSPKQYFKAKALLKTQDQNPA